MNEDLFCNIIITLKAFMGSRGNTRDIVFTAFHNMLQRTVQIKITFRIYESIFHPNINVGLGETGASCNTINTFQDCGWVS